MDRTKPLKIEEHLTVSIENTNIPKTWKWQALQRMNLVEPLNVSYNYLNALLVLRYLSLIEIVNLKASVLNYFNFNDFQLNQDLVGLR